MNNQAKTVIVSHLVEHEEREMRGIAYLLNEIDDMDL